MSEDLFAAMRECVVEALAALVPGIDAAVLARVEVTPAREAAHGDMATNAALLAARPARRKPAEIAAELAARLALLPQVQAAEAAGPGFVNLTLHAATLRSVLPTILRVAEAYGDGTLGRNAAGRPIRVNIEYVSANPTGPMHIGHCRGAVVGDALVRLMRKAGYEVTAEYYVNDAGNQVAALGWAVYWRYLQALGTDLTEAQYAAAAPLGLQYRGDYLLPVADALVVRHGDALAGAGGGIADPALWLATVRDESMELLLADIRADLAHLGVRHDVFTSERAMLAAGAPDAAIGKLDAAGLLYRGILEPPRGKQPEDWEPREQLLFRSTDFGDDVDRALRKSDGTNTYFANDIGYHDDKLARGFDILIDVLGADHGGYVTRMRAAVSALSGRRVEFDVVMCQIVHVLRGGVPVRMSKRAGTYVALSDLLDEVGRDAVRFTMLTRKNDAQMEFDIEAAIAQTRDNPVFYVQYAHARCRSVLRKAAELELPTEASTLAVADLTPLDAPAERTVLRRLMAWPRTVEGAAQAREPHRIAFYLYELAADFHSLQNKGREDTVMRFIQPDAPGITAARLALVAATAMVIRSGLAVLGVTPVEEMR